MTVEDDRLRLPLAQPLPRLCVKCGRTDGLTVRLQRFRWVSPWVNLLIVAGLVPAIVLQMILTKRALLSLPICPSCDSRWSTALVASRLVIYGPLALAVVGCVLGATTNWGGPIAAVTVLLLLPAWIIGPALVYFALMRPRSLRATRIDSYAITLAGLCPVVLEAARGERASR
jgi:hypothetical protein